MVLPRDGLMAHAMTAVLTAGVTLTGSYWQLKGTQSNVEPAYVDVLQQEIKALRSELTATQAQVLTLTIKNADLQRVVGGGIEEIEAGAVFAYIDALERPAWCKKVEHVPPAEPVFRMAYLNYAYSLVYGVSVAKYIGGTDFDNHPRDVAKAYYENDMKTYREKDYIEFLEPVSVAERETYKGERRFAKFWFALPSGGQYICGIQVNTIK